MPKKKRGPVYIAAAVRHIAVPEIRFAITDVRSELTSSLPFHGLKNG